MPIGAGGYGDYFALVFEDDPADDSKMIFKAFVSGSIPVGIPALNKAVVRIVIGVNRWVFIVCASRVCHCTSENRFPYPQSKDCIDVTPVHLLLQ